VDRQLRSTVDILAAHSNLVALYGPEHGVRGSFSAGDHVADRVDERTGVPVYSLYGSKRKPDAAMLENVDILVYDIQDIGVRSYTYISTMGLLMEAAAEQDKEVLILDRPNPLGGRRIEGPLVAEGFSSFVSQYPVPYVYGLSCGELAMMLNEEGMLSDGVSCRLKVVAMEGWNRNMSFEDCKLPWVPTSPHIPQYSSALAYPATGIIGELDPTLIGIGYTLPFQVLTTLHIDAQQLADSMNRAALPGVLFRPIHLKPYYQRLKGEAMQGVQIHFTDPHLAPLTPIQFLFLHEVRKIDPSFDPFAGKENRYTMFDKVCGKPWVREMLMGESEFENFVAAWNREVEAFRELSRKYYLYE